MGRKVVALFAICFACGGYVDPGHGVQPQPGPTPQPVYSPPPSSGPIANGGFENGNLDGWTALGQVAVESFDTDSGKFAARLGPGDATLSQTFQAPYGMQLVLWYDDACSGNGAASATVRDQATGATYFALPATCDATPAWRSATLDLSGMGGDTITLSLMNHDGGSGAFTLFDDVYLQSPPPEIDPGPSPECVFDSDCSADSICSAGTCVYSPPQTDECTFDSDCGTDYACSAGTCVYSPPPPTDSCSDDFDCGGDQVCDGGSCVEPPPDCGSAPRPSRLPRS